MHYSQSEDKGRTLLTLSVFMAFASLLTIQFVIMPFILGGLGILFALLSRGCMTKVARAGRIAIAVSCASMVLTLLVVFFAIQTLLTNPSVRKQVNDYSMQIYGESFDDMVEEAFHTELPYRDSDK